MLASLHPYLVEITLLRDESARLYAEHIGLDDAVFLLQLSQQLLHVLLQEIQLLLPQTRNS